MTQAIVTYLNAVIDTVGRVDERYCMAELRSDGTTTVPYTYVGNGKVKPISIDGGSLSYWRISGAVPPMEQIASQYGKPRLSATYPLRLVIIARRADSTVDDGFMPTRLAEDIANALTGSHPDLKTLLKANTVSVSAGYDVNITSVWADEFKGTGVNDPNYTRTIMALSVSVTVVGDRACWENECDYDPDILHLFDFCQAGTVARLTPEQATCLEAALCEPCADATVTVNTTPFGTAPSGGGLNVPVKNTDGTLKGSKIGPDWVVPDATLQQNTIQRKLIPTGTSFNLVTKLDGVANNGVWDGVDTLDFTSAASGSIAVTVSDATPDFGQTITITATPTGFSPTSYLFFAFDGSTITFIAEQAGNVVNWVVSVIGVLQIYVAGTDGTTEVFDTQSVTSAGDADAAAIIAATGVTDSDQIIAANYLFTELKAAGLYSKARAMHIHYGSTLYTRRLNALDPVYEITSFALDFAGGWSISDSATIPNGVNAFADTHLNPSLHLPSNSMSIGFFSMSNAVTGTDQVDMGCTFGGFNYLWLSSRYSGSNRFLSRNSSSSVLADSLNNDGSGWYLSNKTSNSAGAFKTSKNGVVQDTDTGAGVNPNGSIYYGALNNNSIATLFSNRPHGFDWIGEGLTDTESSDLYTIVYNFMILSGKI